MMINLTFSWFKCNDSKTIILHFNGGSIHVWMFEGCNFSFEGLKKTIALHLRHKKKNSSSLLESIMVPTDAST